MQLNDMNLYRIRTQPSYHDLNYEIDEGGKIYVLPSDQTFTKVILFLYHRTCSFDYINLTAHLRLLDTLLPCLPSSIRQV